MSDQHRTRPIAAITVTSTTNAIYLRVGQETACLFTQDVPRLIENLQNALQGCGQWQVPGGCVGAPAPQFDA